MGKYNRITLEDLDIREDGTIWYNGLPKKMIVSPKGYVNTCFDRGKHSVHRLVAQKFIPNPENKGTVNHKNGIKTDNRVCNLEWLTQKENNQHAHDTGLKGMLQLRQRKLTMEQAREIRSKYKTGDYLQRGLAKEYGINYGNISKLLLNKTYKEEV